jgi:hypothetical protein
VGRFGQQDGSEPQPCSRIFTQTRRDKVKLDGENVVAFPKLPEFQQITLKVLHWEEQDKRLLMKEAEMVA